MQKLCSALRFATLAACALFVFSAMPALAAAPKMAPPPGWSWTGFYVGAHVGGTWGVFDNDPTIIGPSGRGGNVMGGGQVGYNWQFGEDVFGLEADGSAIDVHATTGVQKFSEDWQATVRGRYGRAMNSTMLPFSFLPYITAGVALTGTTAELTGTGTNSRMAVGYAVGAGVEAPICNRISARVEYLRTDVPKDNYTVAGTPIHGGSANNTVRAALNYHFGTF